MSGKARRPYLIASLLAHAALLAAVFYVGPYSIKSATLSRHVKNAQDNDIKRRVDEIEKIKTLLEKSRQGAGAPTDGTGGGSAKAGAPATVAQLLEQARRMSEEIEKMERRDKVKELARLLNIPEQQARAKLAPPAPPPVKPAGKLDSAQQALGELQRQQQLARNALLRREQQLAKERGGTRVRPENGSSDQGGAGMPSALAGLGDGGTGKAGKGGAGKNGLQGEDVPNAAHIEITGYIAQTGMAQAKVPRGGSWDLSTPKHKVARSYGEYVPTPPTTTPVGMRKISAHAIGKGAPYADRIFLNRWNIVGPFPGRGPQDSIDVAYPPEMMVDLDAEYRGIGGSTLRWEYLTNPDYPTVPPVRAQDAIYYAYTEVVMDEERDLVLALGSDDDSKLWLNDRLVWMSGDGYKPWYSSPGYVGLSKEINEWNLTEGTRKVHFKKGRNSLLLKLYNGASLLFFSVVIVADAQNSGAL